MTESENKKPPMTAREAVVLGAVFLAVVIYQKRALIEYLAIQNSDGLMFAVWVGILILIYTRLKKTHKDMARERKQLLRLKALEAHQGAAHSDDHENNNENRGPGLPGPRPISALPQAAVRAEIVVGTRLSDGKEIKLSDQKRLGQVHIPGATGRGKTESIILPWMVQDFSRGRSVFLIDGKGDPELARLFCRESSVTAQSEDVFIFDPMSENSCTINPLASGSAQQITDRIVSSFEFPEPYYKSVQADALLTVVSLLRESKEEVTFMKIEQALTDMDHLSQLVNRSADERVKAKVRALVRQKEETRVGNLSGILTQLSPFTTGEIAKLVNGNAAAPEKKVISLMDRLVENPSRKTATLVLLPTLVYQEVAKSLGRMLLQELAYCVGVRAARTGRGFPFTAVFLDEFSIFAYAGFEQILNKARSSGVALHLSHQSMGDLESVSEQFAKIVNTNSNVKCLLGLNDPDTAEFFARHLGTHTTEKFTERMEEREGFFTTEDEKTGMKSVRETESYKVHPNTLKGMSAGQGVLHVPTEHGPVTEEVQFYRVSDLDHGHYGRAAI